MIPMSDHIKPKTYVAGSTGMVGSAISRRLTKAGYPLVGPPSRVDLREQQAVTRLFSELRPEWVFLAAAKVGGIYANSTYPADFIYDNLMIQTNIIQAARLVGTKKLLFLGSACIYPKFAPDPVKEEFLMSGHLEPTNEPYAVAKIAGIIMTQAYNKQYGTNFVSVMPANLYGRHDNFDLQRGHVIPTLLRKLHEAKQSGADVVEIWGTGSPRREFLNVDDLADACVFIMENYNSGEIVNIGSGIDISIRDLAFLIKEIVGYTGDFRFNTEMPNGRPGRLLDLTRLTSIGWKPSIPLREGLMETYSWYLQNESGITRKS
jgi:GDP-L-fucose synthase